MKLIVGLGNPEDKFDGTRHNIGFEVVDNLRPDCSETIIDKGLLSYEHINGEKIMYLKPTTYMNSSGESIKLVKDYYKIDNSDIIVIYDDMSLPLTKVRITNSGSHAGHNGIKSIISCIGEDFVRFKVGIDHPGCREKVRSYVLGKFDDLELDDLKSTIDFIKDHKEDIINEKYQKIMSDNAIFIRSLVDDEN